MRLVIRNFFIKESPLNLTKKLTTKNINTI